jgi:hypothetical protein
MKIKTIKSLPVILLTLTIISACTSTTLIQSVPEGARVIINNETLGVTPYEYKDSKISFSETHLTLELEGYEPFDARLTKDEEINVGAVIGGCLFWFPFIWTMEYKPVHTYELMPLRAEFREAVSESEPGLTVDEIMKLRELKKLLDDGILTKEEFEAEKNKILRGKK